MPSPSRSPTPRPRARSSAPVDQIVPWASARLAVPAATGPRHR
ncbi:MAG: hypothetical protein ACK56I_00645 [bacterium]